jgi:ElaB/YqjD/DUF883 family membrane-anchored ribosome-binding protein
MTNSDSAGQPAAAGDGPPQDAAGLQREIDQTREHLGETVEQLVAKADVKARAQETASELKDQAMGKAAQARTQAAHAAEAVRSQAAAAAAPVRDAMPEPAQQAITKATGTVRQRPVPVAVAVAVLVVGILVIRRWRKR